MGAVGVDDAIVVGIDVIAVHLAAVAIRIAACIIQVPRHVNDKWRTCGWFMIPTMVMIDDDD